MEEKPVKKGKKTEKDREKAINAKRARMKAKFDAMTEKEQERELRQEARKTAILEAIERSGKPLKPYHQHIGLRNGPNLFDMDKQARFCEEYAKHGRKKQAADVVGVSLNTIQRYGSADPIFKEMLAEAQASYRDHVAEEVYRRAIIGVDKAHLGGQFKDEVVLVEKVYSDRLLELEAKRVDPAYRDRGSIDIAVKEGGVLVINQSNEGEWENKFKEAARPEPIDVTPT
jgi:hypothetical protein